MTQIIDLGKLRFNYTGDYVANTEYESNDVVKYGGNVYCYTSPIKDNTTIPTNPNAWTLMMTGFDFQGPYDASKEYRVGMGVSYGATLFVALKDSYGFVPTAGDTWAIYSTGMASRGEWTASTNYFPEDIVQYGAAVWKCKTAHVSANWANEKTKWEKFVGGVRYRGAWAVDTAYAEMDIVTSNNSTYIAVTAVAGQTADMAPSFGNNPAFELLAVGASGVPQILNASNGQVLSSTGTQAVWSSVISSTLTITGTAAVMQNRRYLCDFSAPVSISLPTTPVDGALIEFVDIYNRFNKYPLTLTATAKIQGKTGEALIADLNGVTLTLIYTTALGWRII